MSPRSKRTLQSGATRLAHGDRIGSRGLGIGFVIGYGSTWMLGTADISGDLTFFFGGALGGSIRRVQKHDPHRNELQKGNFWRPKLWIREDAHHGE